MESASSTTVPRPYDQGVTAAPRPRIALPGEA